MRWNKTGRVDNILSYTMAVYSCCFGGHQPGDHYKQNHGPSSGRAGVLCERQQLAVFSLLFFHSSASSI